MSRQYIVGNLRRTNVDLTVQSEGLLLRAKKQMRVQFADDDSVITDMLSQAIQWVEVNADICINPQTWEWSFGNVNEQARYCYCNDWWYGLAPLALPKRPVSSFTMTDGQGADIKSYWQETVQQDSTGITETLLQRVDVAVSTWPLKLTMQCGFTTPTDMPMIVANPVLRYTAYLYENREAIQGAQFYTAPEFTASILGPLWVPRV
jgi:uncharacterized phiE125 gp8 family phage protein